MAQLEHNIILETSRIGKFPLNSMCVYSLMCTVYIALVCASRHNINVFC